ncbi:MAG: hypothetical protein KF915_18705 [Polyangiaceae bacterium]|nr:hypothetical protein [Polyangiaceae bacterium]
MTITRRNLLQTFLALGGTTAGLLAVSCGDDSDPGSGGGPGKPDSGADAATDAGEDAHVTPDATADTGTEPSCDSVGVTIGTNHGHALTVPPADVEAGTDRTYDIRGTSGHPHTIVVSAADFALLADGEMVTVTSSNDNSHTHVVRLVCG